MTARQPLPTAPTSAWRSKRLIERVGEQWRHAPLAPSARALLKRAYHAALSLQTGGRGLRARLPGGEVVRVCPEHRYLSWNPAEYDAFRRAVDTGTIALDVGANVGAYSVLLGQWVGPSGRVFAFEPEPSAFQGLSRHVAMNGLDAIVHPISAALSDHEGTARLVVAATAGETRIGGEVSNPWFQVTLLEGRNREVRRLWESQGHAVSRLKRVRYGAALLPRGLRAGHWAELSAAEHRVLREDVGLPGSAVQLGLELHPGTRVARRPRPRPAARKKRRNGRGR